MNYIEKYGKEIHSCLSGAASIPEDSEGLFYLYALLLLSKGENVTANDVHNAWSAWMTSINPGHPSIQPFNSLPKNIQEMDLPYVDAIKMVAARHGEI